ncbi:sulfurtransferase [Bacillus shivajii]|uniref:sulfurtransferase n=1 Tax=Bacillus shivajii TaxID=1983719 RepID=UPI001CFC39FB|nr:sulfurtransferase [Bacillus shivajii]UCZ52450.1 sulfurtransferase [Bacillus shivajii]
MKLFKTLSFTLLFSIFIVACSNETTTTSEEDSGYENEHLLVDTNWLEENIEDTIVIDIRDEEEYEGGHIPGAVHLDRGEITDQDNPVFGVLVEEEVFQDVMQSKGINDDSTIVIYDGGNSLWASRLFYGLELYGHEDVRILNGGFTAWLSDELELSTEAPAVEEGNFTATLNPDLQASQTKVEEFIGDDTCVIIDTRSDGEYDGSDVRAERGGHIPGATHIEWSEALNAEGIPTFKSAEELEELFSTAGVDRDKTIVPYCQTNVRGAHTYFSLRLLGFENIIPYEGSWAEWGNDPESQID